MKPHCPKCQRSLDPEDIESGGCCHRCHEPLEYPEDREELKHELEDQLGYWAPGE